MQWVIDPVAAETVRHIFALCLDGKGPMKTAELTNKPLKSGNGVTPFRGYTVTYIKNFLTGCG